MSNCVSLKITYAAYYTMNNVLRNKHILHVMLVSCFTALIVTVYWNELQRSRGPPSRLGGDEILVS